MLQFDRSIHPVVLYEYHLILIFVKIHENLKKNEGKSRKNYKPRGGVKVESILHSWGLSKSCQIVQWDVKRSSLEKKFGMRYGENAWFPWQPLI